MEQKYDIAWDVKAGEKLKEIYNYLKENYSLQSAKKIKNEIFKEVEKLRDQPERFPPEPLLAHRKENYRYLLVRSYKIIYEFTGSEVRILFIHGTRQDPRKIIEALG